MTPRQVTNDWTSTAMIPPIQRTIVEKLLASCDLSPDIRFGQLVAFLGFLSEEFENQSLWDIEDEQLLHVIEIHLAQLSQRQAGIAHLAEHYERLPEDEQTAEDEQAEMGANGQTVISVPEELLPAIRQLLATQKSA